MLRVYRAEEFLAGICRGGAARAAMFRLVDFVDYVDRAMKGAVLSAAPLRLKPFGSFDGDGPAGPALAMRPSLDDIFDGVGLTDLLVTFDTPRALVASGLGTHCMVLIYLRLPLGGAWATDRACRTIFGWRAQNLRAWAAEFNRQVDPEAPRGAAALAIEAPEIPPRGGAPLAEKVAPLRDLLLGAGGDRGGAERAISGLVGLLLAGLYSQQGPWRGPGGAGLVGFAAQAAGLLGTLDRVRASAPAPVDLYARVLRVLLLQRGGPVHLRAAYQFFKGLTGAPRVRGVVAAFAAIHGWRGLWGLATLVRALGANADHQALYAALTQAVGAFIEGFRRFGAAACARRAGPPRAQRRKLGH